MEISKIEDPYLKYGGAYSESDVKNCKDFKYVEFAEVPAFTDAHKSLMAKVVTPEVFASLKDVKSA